MFAPVEKTVLILEYVLQLLVVVLKSAFSNAGFCCPQEYFSIVCCCSQVHFFAIEAKFSAEVEFVHAVTGGGSVKFFPAV